jgi:hypothetical protein
MRKVRASERGLQANLGPVFSSSFGAHVVETSARAAQSESRD